MSTEVKEAETQNLTRYQKDVLRSAKGNHIWLNAFSCIRPTPEFLQSIGQEVMAMLKYEPNLILSDDDGGPFEELKMKELVIRVNKS